MAKKKSVARLSVGEIRLMAVLWKSGPLKLAEVFRDQPGTVGYTTIQTQLNRLVEKRVVTKSKARPTLYRAVVDPKSAIDATLQLLVDTVGSGSIVPLIEQLMDRNPPTKSELRLLKKLIEKSDSAKPGLPKRTLKRITKKRATKK
jgi:predicted transcriptional regulator